MNIKNHIFNIKCQEMAPYITIKPRSTPDSFTDGRVLLSHPSARSLSGALSERPLCPAASLRLSPNDPFSELRNYEFNTSH